MANLIIKPTSGGSLILQDEGGTAAHTIDASGNHTLANNTTLSGTANNLGTATAGTLGSAVTFPAGHVVRTNNMHDRDVSAHISTTNTSDTASGILVSTPACTGSNYNIITFSASGYVAGNVEGYINLYANKNGAGYSLIMGDTAGVQMFVSRKYYATHLRFAATWIDNAGLTAGTNIYQIYMRTQSGTFYLVHNKNDYHLIVQEIQA